MASSESRFEELKRYVRFGEKEAKALSDFHPLAAPHFQRIANEFYDRIREHEDAHAVFTGEDQIQRLVNSLQRWMHRLCTGPYDQSYFEETAHIGRVHVRIGLPQRYMFTAMALIRVSLTRLADDSGRDDATEIREALTRLLDLELAIMLETYQESFVARIQHVERLEMQELNRALARTEHRYVNAVELARALIIGVDAAGVIRLFNREAERVTGLGRDEVLGEPFVDVVFPEDLRSVHGDLVRRVLGGEAPPEAMESVLRTRAGKLRDVIWSLSYAPSQGEDEIVLFAMGNDVTEAKGMEERTRQAEKLAAVGTLAAGLAHEIRNPLNGAQLHIAFLDRAIKKKVGSDPDMQEAVQVVADEIKRLAVLVSEFLDFARPKPLTLKSVSMMGLLTRVRDLVSAQASQAKVELVTDLPTADVELSADPGKLEQVFLNLAKNAVEALEPTGGGTAVLRMRRQPRHVIVEVEDDGPGLPDPDAPIFDAFFTTKAGGTGLGLAITHRIITDHGGTIDVSSKPGRTTFRVTLPLKETRT